MKHITPIPEKVLLKMSLQRTKAYRKKLYGIHTGLTVCDCGCGEMFTDLYSEQDLPHHVDLKLLEIVKNELNRINEHFVELS